jgi:pre-rRNA-processing protein TSR1
MDLHNTLHLILFQPSGRVPHRSPKSISSSAAAQTRLNRRNNAKQVQAQKRQALISSTRIFHGTNGAPRIVAVIPLTADVDARLITSSLAASLEILTDDCPDGAPWTIRCVFVTMDHFLPVMTQDMLPEQSASKPPCNF